MNFDPVKYGGDHKKHFACHREFFVHEILRRKQTQNASYPGIKGFQWLILFSTNAWLWNILYPGMFYTWNFMHKEIHVTSKLFYFMVTPVWLCTIADYIVLVKRPYTLSLRALKFSCTGHIINFPIIAPTWNITNAITNIDLSLSLGSVAIVIIIAIFL